MPNSIRANYPRMNTSSIAVIEFRLASIGGEGSPFISVKNELGPFFRNISTGREFFQTEILININPDDPKSLERHQKLVATYIKLLAK
jgi:hypothetical protein